MTSSKQLENQASFLSRRSTLKGLAALSVITAVIPAIPALAQKAPQGNGPEPFRFEDVLKRARDAASAPFESNQPALPEPLNRLDFDTYRNIRFRPDKALTTGANSPFLMQMFHLGFLYQRPVTVNIIKDGIPAPVPYQSNLFDLGGFKFEKPLPVNLGFAGFRLHYPLNKPNVNDELIAFLGASYFRFLGRDQNYGLSARGIAVNIGENDPEEFPRFREFWVEPQNSDTACVTIYAMLDGPSLTGAYRFRVYPEDETTIEVTATLFPRKEITSIGIAPLSSMFFRGENDRHAADDFRPEAHDSDGLLMQSGSGEWIWRPLRNPDRKRVSSFVDNNPRGFGLMQRDRVFENYQDLEAAYHKRPGYWIEPIGQWGEGAVELLELPTDNETHDNTAAYWQPKQPLKPGQETTLSYKLTAVSAYKKLHPGGRAINTFQTPARASGSNEPSDPTTRRFMIDFAGKDLTYYLSDPSLVEIVPSTSNGKILRTFIVPNEHIGGFRAAVDVKLDIGQSTDLRVYLKSGNRTLTETWTYPWDAS
ncbi:glucan biosynthesis protein G [Microvirga sp. W0021]|uniref:Glucan biosynthesis protein G n=1 Tax=Hohaiivirga grylli TaxID=3133970 RepID=A0ABV0BJF1_9HYPH